MKKKLASLFLALALGVSASAAMAAEITVSDPQASSAAEVSAKYNKSEDGEAYRSAHPKADSPAPVSGGFAPASAKVRSIYNGKYYSVPTSNLEHGIDVSKWEGDINWTKVKKSGTDFAIVRCGYRGYGNGTIYGDPKYDTYMRGAAAAGVPTGVYIYSQAKTPAEGRAEARYCLNAVKGYSVEYPIVMDIEYAEGGGGYTGRLYNAHLSRQAMTDVAKAFCETIEAAGYTPMIYANRYMLTDKMSPSQLSGSYPVWMACYSSAASYGGAYSYWQYSETGRVSGISTYVDCNFYFPSTNPASRKKIDCTEISLDQTEVTAEIGDSLTLKASRQPSNTTDRTTWSSSDPSVAAVSSKGKLTAVGTGSAVITATAGKVSASCTVTVTPSETMVSKLKLTSTGNYTLTFSANGADSYDIYRSEDGTEGSFVKIGSSTDGTYTDTAALSGQNYCYRVIASADRGGAHLTGEVSNTVRTDYLPQPARLVSLSKYGRLKLRLRWENAYGASSYYIYRSGTGLDGSYKLKNRVSSKTSYISSNLTVGKTYYFYIRPYITIDDVKYIGQGSQALSIKR